MFWHTFDLPHEVADAFAEAYQRVVPDSPFRIERSSQGPDAYQALFTKAAEGIRTAGGFGDPEQWRFDWERSYTRDEWLDQLPTSGALTRLPNDAVAAVLADAGSAIDAMGGTVTIPYATVVVTAARS